MKYSVDRVEDNIIVLQNINTKEIIEINKKDINFKVVDGDIIIFKDNKFIKDKKLKEDRLRLIQEKINKVKGLK